MLPYLHDEVRTDVLREMDHEDMVAVLENRDAEDMADALHDLQSE